jgi:integrase
MGRKRTGPWFRDWDQCWYTTINRKPVKLGTAADPKQLIEARYKELVALTSKPDQLTVHQLIYLYLDFCKSHRSDATYQWYKDFLDPFKASVSSSLQIERLTPSMVTKWIDKSYGESAPSTRHGAGRAVTRMVNWAIAERKIDRSPLIGFVKPAATNREAILTEVQYDKCLRYARGPIRDVCRFLWHTCCRPAELRMIEFRWLDGNKITLPARKSKGKKRKRVIYLDATALEIVRELSVSNLDNLTGPIFRNSRDKPWTKDALNSAMGRLKAKVKIDGLCAYSFRHGFATRMLKRADLTSVAALMGSSPKTIADETHLLSLVAVAVPTTMANV